MTLTKLLESAETLARRWGLTQHASLHLACLLAAHPGVPVSSGRRSAERNRAVGGSPSSFHLRGRAVDLGITGARAEQVARTARAQRVSAGCTGPEEVFIEADHLHLAW